MAETRYKFQGPGIIRALQEAVKNKKNLGIAYDHDNQGHLLRIGYYFKDRDIQDIINPKITWFSPEEIQIVAENASTRDFNKALLDVEFSKTKEHERHFMISLEIDVNSHITLRNIFRIHKNAVIGFVIQIEIQYVSEGQILRKPVVRYDHAHGFIHRDMIASSGEKTKTKLKIQDTRKAIIFAVEELRININDWLKNLGYKTIEKNILNQTQLNSEIEKAKNRLLELYDNPKQLDETHSTLVVFTETERKERIWPPS